jgi:hypothetical protein
MLNDFKKSRGFALVTSLLLLLLLSGIAVGTIYMVTSERTVNANDLQDTQAYYGAEAAMEKMMADLGQLYAAQASPQASAITNLGTSSYYPTISGITYNTYSLTFNTVGSLPASSSSTVPTGAFAGLLAQIVPITLTVDAQGSSGADVSMIRNVEVALIPVFQFGVFSDGDMSFYPGENFNMYGRVHTNGNLFLATFGSQFTMTFHSKMTAAGEVVRLGLPNGYPTSGVLSSGSAVYNGANVMIPTVAGACDNTPPFPATCRTLNFSDDGSLVGNLGAGLNPGWVTLSKTTYNSMLANYKTGVTSLSMPFVAEGYRPIEILRRPWPTEISAITACATASCYNALPAISRGRMYTIAQIRVLMNDTLTDTAGNANFPTPGNPVRLANTTTTTINGTSIPGYLSYQGGSTSAPKYGNTLALGPCPKGTANCGTAFAEATVQTAALSSGSVCVPPQPGSSTLTTWPAACQYEPGLGPTPGSSYALATGSCSVIPDSNGITRCGNGCWRGGYTPAVTGSHHAPASCGQGIGSNYINPATGGSAAMPTAPYSYETRQDFVLPPNNPPNGCASLDNFITNYPPSNNSNAYCWPLIDGYLLVQVRDSSGAYHDVTQEWLGYGIGQSDPVDTNNSSVVDSNAILSFQRYADIDGDGTVDVCNNAPATTNNNAQWGTNSYCTGLTQGSIPYNPNYVSQFSASFGYVQGQTKIAYVNGDPRKFYPLQMYDTREGEARPGGALGGFTSGTSNYYYDSSHTRGPYSVAGNYYGNNPGGTQTGCGMNGIINVVELNVQNLQRWLYGQLPASPAGVAANPSMGSLPSGAYVDSLSQNGYIFYYSDRRGMNVDPNALSYSAGNPPVSSGSAPRLTGGYGFADLVNPASSVGAPNNTLDSGEDIRQNGIVDTFGASTTHVDSQGNTITGIYQAFSNTPFPGNPANPYPDPFTPVLCGSFYQSLNPDVARKNKVTGARHALRLVNGGLGNLPGNQVTSGGTYNQQGQSSQTLTCTPASGQSACVEGGFTVASENPVYVMGNYNGLSTTFSEPSCSVATTGCHVAAAVMGDAVILLSSNWSDLQSFVSPNSASSRSAGIYAPPAAGNVYRMAIIQGKTPTAPYANYTSLTGLGCNSANCPDFGTDGGVPNFLRYLEYWSNSPVYYDGSMVSFFYSEYFTGYFKSANTTTEVYGSPKDSYAFDTDFATALNLLPPGTPNLRDVENVGFQQLFTPY